MVHSVPMLLRALQHPQADSVQLDALRNLVPWLEDRKIRAYKVEDRPALASTDSPDWQCAYDRVSGFASSFSVVVAYPMPGKVRD